MSNLPTKRKAKNKSTPPFQIGDIVTMKLDGPTGYQMIANAGRLMRVTYIHKETSQSGFVVNVKVNERPIHDLQGKECYELIGFDCDWFKKYEVYNELAEPSKEKRSKK